MMPLPTGGTTMRYLITGGAGFIGSHMADHLIARGDEVLAMDDLSTGSLRNVAHLDGGAPVPSSFEGRSWTIPAWSS